MNPVRRSEIGRKLGERLQRESWVVMHGVEAFASRARLMTEIHSLNPKKAASKAAAAAAADADAESGAAAASPRKDAKKLEKKKSLKRL